MLSTKAAHPSPPAPLALPSAGVLGTGSGEEWAGGARSPALPEVPHPPHAAELRDREAKGTGIKKKSPQSQ